MRSVRLRVRDILSSEVLVREFIRGKSKDQFLLDAQCKSAVCRELGTMGESAKHVPVEVQNLRPEIPWREMAGIRDKLIHEYFRTDFEIVWRVASSELPVLHEHIRSLFYELK